MGFDFNFKYLGVKRLFSFNRLIYIGLKSYLQTDDYMYIFCLSVCLSVCI